MNIIKRLKNNLRYLVIEMYVEDKHNVLIYILLIESLFLLWLQIELTIEAALKLTQFLDSYDNTLIFFSVFLDILVLHIIIILLVVGSFVWFRYISLIKWLFPSITR